jgi:hypothetical protein
VTDRLLSSVDGAFEVLKTSISGPVSSVVGEIVRSTISAVGGAEGPAVGNTIVTFGSEVGNSILIWGSNVGKAVGDLGAFDGWSVV